MGKRSAALGLAMALCCGAEPGQGCGVCEVCRRIGGGLHPDVPTFATDGPQIVIEQAQTIVALAQSRPHEAPVRVIIIDDADRLNLNAANCLLKTLEEPAAGTHIVLVTSAPDRILPTIRSRTQRVRFRALPAAALVEVAVARGAERERAQVAAALADGSVARGDARRRGSRRRRTTTAGAVACRLGGARHAAGRPGVVGALFDAAVAAAGDKENKQELPRLLALLARLYRDAMAAAAGAPELALFAERVGRWRGGGRRACLRALGAIVEADAALAANVNAVTAVERMLLVLRRRPGRRAA